MTIILQAHCSFISIQLILPNFLNPYSQISNIFNPFQYNILLHNFTPSSFLHLHPISIQINIHIRIVSVFSTIMYSISVILHTLNILPVLKLLKQNFYLSKNREFTDVNSNQNTNLLQILKHCIYQNVCIKFFTIFLKSHKIFFKF